MNQPFPARRIALLAAASLALSANADAAMVDLTITVQNLAPANSIAFAPLHVALNSGVYDSFNMGSTPSAAIVSVAEGGAGAIWHSEFAAMDPGATRGTVPGALMPGASQSLTLRVDSAVNPFFSYAAMVIPSNDFFIGNDSPTAYTLFDSNGNLNFGSIVLKATEIWDAGDEVFDPAAAAFVGDNDLRSAQGSVVALNFAELAGFNGLTTAAGYTFSSGLTKDSEVYRISFSAMPVPEPGSYALMAAGLLVVGGIAARRRSRIAVS